MCAYPGWIDATISLTLDEQSFDWQEVRLYSCYKLLLGFNLLARGQNPTPLSCPNTTIVTLGARVSWLNRRTDLVGPGRTACTSVFLCVWRWRCYLRSIHCEVIISLTPCPNILQWRWPVYIYIGCINGTISLAPDKQFVRLYSCAWPRSCYRELDLFSVIISPPFPVKILHWRWPAFMWVKSMERSHRTDGQFVFLCAWLWSCHLGSIRDNLTFICCQNAHNGDNWSAFICVASMERSHWLWTTRMYVCMPVLDFEGVLGGLIQGAPIIFASIPVKICYNYNGRRLLILVESVERLRWPRATSSYVCVHVCFTLKLQFEFDV